MTNNDMEKKLDQLLAGLPKPQYDTDTWLIEDHTAEFDRIVRQRRRKVWGRRLAAAAAVIGALCVIGTKLEKQTDIPQTQVTHKTTQPIVVQPQPEEPLLVEVTPERKAPQKAWTQKTKKAAAAQPTSRQMTPVDSLADIIAHIETSMQGVRDSCYIANVEKLIRVDDRLQRLVNELLLEDIVNEPTVPVVLNNPENND